MLLFTSMSHAEQSSQEPYIFVTLPPLSGLVLLLAPQAQVQCLLSNNADPHHFQIKPRQVERLHQAKLLVRSPRDDGYWSSLAAQAPTLSLWQKEHKHTHHAHNHAWLNPKEVSAALPKLAQTLSPLFPMNNDSIHIRLHDATKMSQDMWHQWQSFVEEYQLQQRGVMMQHPSWKGLFEALGVPIRGILESTQHGQEYGPRNLEKALATLQKYPQTILIGDTNHSNRALLWLQKHSLHRFTKLDALGHCGEPWADLMQRNLKTLKAYMAQQP